jgi:hypothetical protein
MASSSARKPARGNRKWTACPNSHGARQRSQSGGAAPTVQLPIRALAVLTTANQNARAMTKQAAPAVARLPQRPQLAGAGHGLGAVGRAPACRGCG